ncbi:hypothetical protein [Parasphingorhabdus sp.]|uniref:hypothetical protein n=1 Tax=Parasphingorhabdus sp. TaxID=2709688 RepID=UPI002B26B803|nr:hypothetical protein [Parasphingorhabdus sp.]
MSDKRDLNAFLDFMDYLSDKGLMAKNTAQARKAAANKVLGVLSSEETSDVTTIDLDDAIQRFSNLQGQKYTPQSLVTYKSRVRSALDDFEAYLKNPLGFRPSINTRERKSKKQQTGLDKSASQNNQTANETPPQIDKPSTGPMSNSIIPIAIRSDLTVFVQGLPFDLSESEANKIANVIKAMAMT